MKILNVGYRCAFYHIYVFIMAGFCIVLPTHIWRLMNFPMQVMIVGLHRKVQCTYKHRAWHISMLNLPYIYVLQSFSLGLINIRNFLPPIILVLIDLSQHQWPMVMLLSVRSRLLLHGVFSWKMFISHLWCLPLPRGGHYAACVSERILE